MSTVVLQVYDLSQGMARSMSRMLLGKQIDGIWHTSVVVYGSEYFYGGGIAHMAPKTTPYGQPVQELTMGQTGKTKEEFMAFLRRLSPRYSMEGYHILYHNCNNFTNDCLEFLLSTSLPAHIKDLPMEFLNTPLGRSLEPTISRFMQMTVGMGDFGPRLNTDDLISHEMVFVEAGLGNVTTHEQLHTTMRAEKAVLIHWEAEGVLEVSEALNSLPLEFPGVTFACIDSARFPYLSPVNYPQIEIYSNDTKTASIPGYNLKSLRKFLTGSSVSSHSCEFLNYTKPRFFPTDWNSARGNFLSQLQSGQLDSIDPNGMEALSKWNRRKVVLNIPEFVSVLIDVCRKIDDCGAALELLAGLGKEKVSNQEIAGQISTGLVEIVSKTSSNPKNAYFQLIFLSNLLSYESGAALVKSQSSSLYPVLLSHLNSDLELVQTAAAAALINLKRVSGGKFSLDDGQEYAALLLDRLTSAVEDENVEVLASALAMLMQENEEITGFIKELGVETIEEKLETEGKYQGIVKDLKAIWTGEKEE